MISKVWLFFRAIDSINRQFGRNNSLRNCYQVGFLQDGGWYDKRLTSTTCKKINIINYRSIQLRLLFTVDLRYQKTLVDLRCQQPLADLRCQQPLADLRCQQPLVDLRCRQTLVDLRCQQSLVETFYLRLP